MRCRFIALTATLLASLSVDVVVWVNSPTIDIWIVTVNSAEIC